MYVSDFFAALWQDYVRITPQARTIHDLFSARGERVVNDHVAFRTFNLGPIRLQCLEPLILALGYRRFAPYQFAEKKLRAVGYVHNDPSQPRIFLSELETEKLSAAARSLVGTMVDAIPDDMVPEHDTFWSGRLWPALTYKQYKLLREESEYAAWLSLWGLRANHFTVSVNHLKETTELAQVLALVKNAGFPLNNAGGEIKGSPQVLLEQGATLADRVDYEFAGGEHHPVPSCYYEFAKRYPDEQGRLYDGFVPASADRLFASTNVNENVGRA